MASLVVAGDSSGAITIAAPAVAGTNTLTLPASTGTLVVTGGAQTIEFADGSAAAPSITNSGDTNTGIYFPAADTIAFTEGGTESMRIDSSGNVGVGTTTPNIYGTSLARYLTVSTATASGYSVITTAGGAGGGGEIDFGNQTIRHAGLASLDGSALAFYTNGTNSGVSVSERMRITSAGDVGIGITPDTKFEVSGTGAVMRVSTNHSTSGTLDLSADATAAQIKVSWYNSAVPLVFKSGNTEQMRIDSSGNVMVAKTTLGSSSVGCELRASGLGVFTASAPASGVMIVNRNTDDGSLVDFRQDNTLEGTISVSGSTVSYNGGHLSRWSQLPDGSKDDTILKGTVLSNLDDMCVWEKDGVVADNEQLNKMKVSDVEGDTNVAGVFVNWTMDEQYGVDDMNVAMTGDMIIRIAQGVVVQKGDLLMSAGDGTAKPQGDDIRRSKTVAKVISNHVTCTYEDGSYCVPCVLMAC